MQNTVKKPLYGTAVSTGTLRKTNKFRTRIASY